MRTRFGMLVVICLAGMSGSATTSFAQQQAPQTAVAPAREPYITATGATVDKPGVPQGSAPTTLDHNIQKQDNKIDGSICNGC